MQRFIQTVAGLWLGCMAFLCGRLAWIDFQRITDWNSLRAEGFWSILFIGAVSVLVSLLLFLEPIFEEMLKEPPRQKTISDLQFGATYNVVVRKEHGDDCMLLILQPDAPLSVKPVIEIYELTAKQAAALPEGNFLRWKDPSDPHFVSLVGMKA